MNISDHKEDFTAENERRKRSKKVDYEGEGKI